MKKCSFYFMFISDIIIMSHPQGNLITNHMLTSINSRNRCYDKSDPESSGVNDTIFPADNFICKCLAETRFMIL